MSAVFLAGLVVAGRRCVVMGGDREAETKTGLLVEAGATVVLIAKTLEPGLEALVKAQPAIEWQPREAVTDDTRDAFLVISTPRDPSWSAALFERAISPRGFLLCCIDQPDFCTFANVASVRRGPVQIGMSTDGEAPLLASRLRQALEHSLDQDFTDFVERIATLRRTASPAERRAVIAHALEGFEFDVSYKLPK